MSYTLLTGLYFGEASNADLTSREARARLHVPTPLEELVTSRVARGQDVILTGNPGDGKSHLLRTLEDRGALNGALLEHDLSARSTIEVVSAWRGAREARRPFVMCANEGPLVELLAQVQGDEFFATTAAELRRQLGHLLIHRQEDLPAEPERTLLIDLADRSVVALEVVDAALSRVATEDFLPSLGYRSTETSAGRNLLLLAKLPEVRKRFAKLLTIAGQRCGEHVTFRQLWGAIAFALTAAKKESTLRQELSQDRDGLGTSPVDNLVKPSARGTLLEAARRYADPALVTDPDLDEQLWSQGQPSTGSWLLEDEIPRVPPPMRVWADGRREAALTSLAQLKRLVALSHEQGAGLLLRLAVRAAGPAVREDARLLGTLISGLRALYLTPSEASNAPEWLRDGLPLWIGLTYRDVPPEERPHAAVRALLSHEFELRRPLRAPWLGTALGPLPDEVWLIHSRSGVALRVDAELLELLEIASRSSGPMQIPERVQRFLSRLSGTCERDVPTALEGMQMAILRQPRGMIEATAQLAHSEDGRVSYV